MPATESSRANRRRPRSARCPLSFGPFIFDTRTASAHPRRAGGCRSRRASSASSSCSSSVPVTSCRARSSSTGSGRTRSSPTRRSRRPSACCARRSATTRRRRPTSRRSTAAATASSAPCRRGEPGGGHGLPGVRRAQWRRIVSPSIGGQLVPWSMAVICALIAAVAVWQLTRPRSRAPPPRRGLRSPPRPAHVRRTARRRWPFSPDGSQLAWSACDGVGCRLYRPRRSIALTRAPVAGSRRRPGRRSFRPTAAGSGSFADGRLMKVVARRRRARDARGCADGARRAPGSATTSSSPGRPRAA